MLKLKNHGDTLVEVLIALAILGMALAISYATANRSLAGAQRAQEHAEALELLQSQVEDLRFLAPNSSVQSQMFQTATSYCISNPNSATPIANLTGPVGNLSSYPTACKQGTDSRYLIAVSYADSAASPDTFTVTAYWDNVVGTGQDQASLVYRVHE